MQEEWAASKPWVWLLFVQGHIVSKLEIVTEGKSDLIHDTEYPYSDLSC